MQMQSTAAADEKKCTLIEDWVQVFMTGKCSNK